MRETTVQQPYSVGICPAEGVVTAFDWAMSCWKHMFGNMWKSTNSGGALYRELIFLGECNGATE